MSISEFDQTRLESAFDDQTQWFYGLLEHEKRILSRRIVLEQPPLDEVAKNFDLRYESAVRIERALRSDFHTATATILPVFQTWLLELAHETRVIRLDAITERLSPGLGGAVIACLFLEEAGWNALDSPRATWTLEQDVRSAFLSQLDWFHDLPERECLVFRARLQNTKMTLENLGESLGITRERVRQIESALRNEFSTRTAPVLKLVQDWLLGRTDGSGILEFQAAVGEISTLEDSEIVLRMFLRLLDWRLMVENGNFWSSGTTGFQRMEAIEPTGPVPIELLLERAKSMAIPDPLIEDFLFSFGRLLRYESYFIREKEEKLDKIQVFLLEKKTAQTNEIHEKLGSGTEHAIREFMRRKPELVNLGRTRGGWGLASAFETPVFSSTLPAVLSILETDGPQTYQSLLQKLGEVHPVSTWRVKQVLEDNQIGEMDDGKIGLVRLGARKTELEPNRPSNMTSQGNVTGVRISIDSELLRGSGIAVHKWMSWSVGLRHPPESTTFRPEDPGDDPLVVKRTGSGTSLTTLRPEVRRRGLALGCEIIVLVNSGTQSWSLQHACEPDKCPLLRQKAVDADIR